jgi:cytoskeletal protein CcmA (bactofilin family)
VATINSGNSTTLYSTTQTTTSVNTATNLPQDRVNETNFTTLYSNPSGSATGGGTSGNLLVSGNLRVLGTSDLEGAVTIGNSYILPTSDGTANQVIVTDGSGNLTFQNVTSLSSYSIQADTTTGGANLTLVGTSTTDSVKFAGGTNITVSRTDASTITISTVADNIPDGTAKGQVLYWDGSAWTANSTITSAAAADRLRLVYDNSTAGVSSALFLRKNFGATAYTSNDGVSLAFQVDSDSQATNQIAVIAADWDPANPTITLNTNINNNTTGPFVNVGQFAANQAILPGGLNVDSGTLYVDATNNRVGINNTSPSYELHIDNGSDAITQFAMTNNERTFILTNNAADDLLSFNYNAVNRLQFDTANQWFSTGRLGVNTSTPGYTLDVQGEANINSNLTVRGTSILGNDYLIDSTTVTGQFSVINNSVTDLFVGTNGYVGIFNTSPAEALDVIGNAIIRGNLDAESISIDQQASIDTNTLTTTSTSTVTLMTTTRNAITGLINIIQGANVHCLNFTALRVDATTALLTTYAEMYNTTALANFTADVSGGSVRLRITPTSATSTVFSVVRTSLT